LHHPSADREPARSAHALEVAQLLAEARRRDAAAEERDGRARLRDRAAAARDARRAGEPCADVVRAGAVDRRRAAQDRAASSRDRLEARAAIEALAFRVTQAETDALTGARTRDAGLVDLEREIDRCRRHEVGLVVAFVDVVGLKALNDTDGHGAGDALLVNVVALCRERLRSYDHVIRVGGDEFVCAMSDVALDDARQRLADIAAALAVAVPGAGLRVGFAELQAGDRADDLVRRADRELVAVRAGEDGRRASRGARG
jgi:diguanylate cyclase (GGDEF)-like protein